MSLKNDFLVSARGISGNFDKWSGGEASANVVKWFPGGARKESQRGGRTTYSDITLERVYNPKTDQALLRKLRAECGVGSYDLSKQPIDAYRKVIGSPESWPKCILKTVTPPDGDSGSEDLSTLVLVFSTTGPA